MGVEFNHQRVSFKIQRIIDNFLQASKCEVISAPAVLVFDWVSKETGGKQKEPDLMVVCDKNVYKGKYFGVPIIIVEIVSPSNFKEDYNEKRDLYERLGVIEYWIVNIYSKEIIRYNLETESKLYLSMKIFTDEFESGVLQDLKFSFSDIIKDLDIEEED